MKGSSASYSPSPSAGQVVMSRTGSTSSRRRFLGRGVGALLAAGVWTEGRAARARSPAEKLRIAAIGVGNRGETNVLTVAGEEVAALCDVDRRYLDERGERFPQARRYADYRELLDRERDLDAVVISSPDHTHAHVARWALQRRLHVYCEKPLVHSLGELPPLVEAARRADVITQTGNQHHASFGYRRAVAWLESGALGDITAAHAWTDRPFWPQGGTRPAPERPPDHLAWDLWLGPVPERPYAANYHPMNWRGYWDFGTGVLGDRGPHLLDSLVTGLKLGGPAEIRAESSPVTEDMAPEWSVVEFRFERPAPAPALRVVWYDGGQQPPRAVTGIERLPPNGCLVIGSEAKLFIPELGGEPRVLVAAGRTPPPPPRDDPRPLLAHMDEWLAACRSGVRTSSDFADGARLAEICLLGNVALRWGRPLRWDALRHKAIDAPGVERYLDRPYRAGWEILNGP